MKRHLHRFLRQIAITPDVPTLAPTRLNHRGLLALPLVPWLLAHGLAVHYRTVVTDVGVDD